MRSEEFDAPKNPVEKPADSERPVDGQESPSPRKPETVSIICAWCKKDMGEKEGHVEKDLNINHGICSECIAKMREEDAPYGEKSE